MKQHFFFDVDGTICESNDILSKEMKATLSKLNGELIAISGHAREKIKQQLDGFPIDYLLCQSGADSPFWNRKLVQQEKVEVLRHIKKIGKVFDCKRKENDLIQDRGFQISYSFTGHNAEVELKRAFDPTGKIRTNVLNHVPFCSNTMEARVAGTTCLDYTHKDYTKGKNIERLLKKLDWKKEDCIYFGDKLKKGGNDETVLGVIDCVEVENPEDLIVKLKDFYEE